MHFFQKNLAHWIIGSRRQYFLLNMLRTDRYDRHIFKFFFSIDSQEQNNFKTAWMRQWVYFRQKCSFSKVIKDGSKHYRGSTKLVVDWWTILPQFFIYKYDITNSKIFFSISSHSLIAHFCLKINHCAHVSSSLILGKKNLWLHAHATGFAHQTNLLIIYSNIRQVSNKHNHSNIKWRIFFQKL